MSFDVVLWGVVAAFVLFLFAMEFYAATHKLPTISERIQGMGRSAPLISVVVSFLAGGLLVHFFG